MDDDQFNFLMESIELLDDKTSDDEIITLINENFNGEDEDTVNTFIKEISKNTNRSVIDLRIIHNDIFPGNNLELIYSADIIVGRKQGILSPEGFITNLFNKKMEIVSTVNSYVWDDFKIINKYQQFEEQETQYDFIVNGILYSNLSFSEMKKDLAANAFSTGGKDEITSVLLAYIKDIPDISSLLSEYIGFHDSGWEMPFLGHKFRYKEAMMKESLKLITKNYLQDIDYKKAIEYFQKVWEMTTISHKGIVFAWNIIAPFLDVIKRYIKCQPLLDLDGGFDTGKSTIEDFFIEKVWGNWEGSFSSGQMESKSRWMGALSASTFPLSIDEAETLPRKHTQDIKSHQTKTIHFTRKSGQKMDIHTPCVSPMNLCHNKKPSCMKLKAVRSRSIHMNITIDLSKQNFDWDLYVKEIPAGYIGKYIVEKTLDWTGKKLMELIKTMPRLDLKYSRQRKIGRIIHLGKYLIKELFDIEVDISELKKVLETTLTAGLEEIFETIKYQAIQGLELWTEKSIDWVKQKTILKRYKGNNGILIDHVRKIELMRFCKGFDEAINTSLGDLHNDLKDKWPDCVHGSIRNNGKSGKYIFVPSKYICGEDINLLKWFNISTQEKLKMDTEAEYKEEIKDKTPEEIDAQMQEEYDEMQQDNQI